MPTPGPGIVYLLHFDGPLAHARHYLGFCENDLTSRLDYHLKGRGSRLVKAAIAAGCEIYLVRLWKGASRDDERRLKGRSSTRYCPACSDPLMNDGFGPKWLMEKLDGVLCPRCRHPLDRHPLDGDRGGTTRICSVAIGELPSCLDCRAPMERLERVRL